MPTISFKAKLKADSLELQIKREIREKIRDHWKKKSTVIRRECAKIYFKHIKQHETYIALDTDPLFIGQMGVTEGMLSEFMDDLKSRLYELFQTEYVGHAGGNDLGGIMAYIESYQEYVYELDYAGYTSTNRKNETTYVPWLRWLLSQGTKDVVFEFHFVPSNDNRFSRTGLGLMVPGGSFAVSPTHAGTYNSNWFTEAADSARPEIMEFMIEKLNEL